MPKDYKMKIALIESHGHSEVVYSLASFFREIAEISVYSTIACKRELELLGVGDGISFFLIDSEVSIPVYLSRNKKAIEGADWIIFVTIEKKYGYFAKTTWKSKTLLIVHDGNYWLDYHKNVQFDSVINILRYIKSIVHRGFYHRKKIISKVDYVAFYASFPYSVTPEYFIKRGLLDKSKILPLLPFTYPFPEIRMDEEKSENDAITIVVPGSIRNNIREYSPVIKAVRRITSSPMFDSTIVLVLLGKPIRKYGKQIQIKFKELEDEKLKVVTFPDVVKKKEYDEWFSKSDFIILPFIKNIRCGACREIGGITKTAGTINDMIRFQKPALIAEGYKLGKDLNPLVKTYTDENDLADKIISWMEKPPVVDGVYETLSKKQKEETYELISFLKDALSS